MQNATAAKTHQIFAKKIVTLAKAGSVGFAGLTQLEGQKLRDHVGPVRRVQVLPGFWGDFESSPQQSRHVLGRQMGWRWLGASRCLILEDIGTWEDAGYRKRGERVPQGIEGLGWGMGVSEAHMIKKSVS